MSRITPARLRAVGTLLFEVARFASLLTQRIQGDAPLKLALRNLITRTRAL